MIHSGDMVDLLKAGARILENACGPCIGMGLAPKSNAISLRTFNRNFLGRSGTKSAQAYLVSPETAAVSAIKGKLTDPRSFGSLPDIKMPDKFFVNDNMIIPPLPPEKAKDVEIIRGPNIKPLPEFTPLADKLSGTVLLKVEDDITTDHIMPAGAKILPLRSNIPEISKFVFNVIDETFHSRSLEKGGGFIVGGENYGQGSSREHAAIAPKYLGLKAVIVKSFARIHLANLVNFGIIPLTFVNKEDYNTVEQGDMLEIDLSSINSGRVNLRNLTKNSEIPLSHSLSNIEVEILKAGGKLPFIKSKHTN